MDQLIVLSSKLCPSIPSEGQIGSIELNLWMGQIAGVPLVGLKKESTSFRMFFLIYGILLMTLLAFIYTAFEMYDLVHCFNDLDALTQNACLSLTHVAGLIKAINTFYRYRDVREVIKQLKAATKKYIVTENQRKTFLRGELENKFFLLAFAMINGFSAILACAMLLYNPQILAGKRFPYRILLPTWLPNSLKLAYMCIGITLFALQIVSIDYLNMNLINNIRFQLKVLNITFDELMINGRNERNLRIRELVKVTGKWITPHQRLSYIIEHHCLLMRIRADVESIYRYPILVQFFMWLIIIAMCGFQAIVSTTKSDGIAVIYCYCCCVFSELFLYCWFGNDVFEQSKTLSDSGYNSTWYQFDEKFKASLLIFLANAQRPFLFTAGGFIALSLQSFTGILSKSYSFIAVLQQFYGR